MRDLGISGVKARRKKPRTTIPALAGTERPSDMLERDFSSDAPNKRWVADITYVRSVGSKGDSYDNAAAESPNSLYKKELIDAEGSLQGITDVTLATLEWVSLYNKERRHSACGYLPPEEFEEKYYARQEILVDIIYVDSKASLILPGRSTMNSYWAWRKRCRYQKWR